MDINKTCSKCKIKKSTDKFYTDKRAKDKVCSQCKECMINHRKTPIGKEVKKNATKRYQKTLRGKEIKRGTRLKYEYGITLEQYDKLLESQGGVCAICGTDTPGGMGRFHIDHDHKTGKIRGLLCNKCNPLLGFHKKTIAMAYSIGYLCE